MKYSDADQLATMLTRNWRHGLNPEIWLEHLERDYSNPHRARTAIIRLTRDKTHAPSIAEFHSAYLTAPDPDVSSHAPCQACDSTGWYHRTAERAGREYGYVEPCNDPTCQHAEQARRVQAKVNAERLAAGAFT